MKIRLVAGVVAALALAGCAGQTKPAAETSDAAVSSTVASETTSTQAATTTTGAQAAAPAKGEKPNRDFVVGKWGTDGDCEFAIDLRADGTSDGPFGNWSYSDGAISFADAPELKVNVTVVDDKTMASVNSDGKSSTMTRCP